MRACIAIALVGMLAAPGCSGGGVDATGAGGSTSSASRSSSTGMGAGSSSSSAMCAEDTIYVAPDGMGDVCSCGMPCALETGRDHARTLAMTASGDVIVLLATGTYRLAKTFQLGAADSGQNGHSINYRAAPGATPVLSGAVLVTGFANDGAGPIQVASVPPGTQSRQLYVGGRRATRARGPMSPGGFTKTGTGFALGDPAMASWPDRLGVELVGTQQWKSFRCPVSDVGAGGITVAEPCWGSSQAQAGYTWDSILWVENAKELIDEGGEFYLDGKGGKLYYLPRAGEDPNAVGVELPVLEEIVHSEGTPAAPLHDVAFEGITFAHGTWLGPSTPDGYASLQASITPRGSPQAEEKPLANVTMRATHAVRFTDCVFEHMGGAALALEVGAQNNLVESCRFEDVSASAIMIGDVTHEDDHHPKDPALIVSDNIIRKSYVTRAGAEYFDATGIFVGYTTRTTIEHNEVFDVPYTGISVGWGWGGVDVGGPGGYQTPSTSQANTVKDNIISHHMRMLRDGGAVYVLGAQAGSVIDGNVVSNQGAPYGNLYLDNGTQGYSVTNNLVLLDPKQDVMDQERSYWLYVQVFNPVAKNNVVGAGNFTNDPTLFTPQPIDPSNMMTMPGVVGADLSPAAAIIMNAGSPLHDPEIAAGKVSMASSVFDAGHTADQGNNGNAYDGWSPSGTDMNPYWQVDLGGEFSITSIEVVSRWAIDQPVTRRSFRAAASDDPAFGTSTVLGEVDATGIPHRAIFAKNVYPAVKARYVRVLKTAPEYFFLGEVRVHGVPAP